MSDAGYEALAVGSQVAGSVIFMAALVVLWVRFVAPAVVASQGRKNAELAEAEARRDAARAEIAAAKADVTAAESDANAIVTRSQGDAERLHQRLVAEARAEGERLMRNAGGELERSRAAANDQLRTELLASALRIARGEAGSLNPATDRRLVEKAVDVADRAGSH